MPGMPYHLEKGPLLSVLDTFCNSGSDARLLEALKRLRSNVPLVEIGAFDSPSLFHATYPWPFDDPTHLAWHFNHHWLGDLAQNDSTTGTQTGHWQNYTGPVEPIVRETLTRALELVLGVRHEPAELNPTATRHWTIDFWWKCPQPWFEGWVTWRRIGEGGHVTVILATPSDDGVVLRIPATEAKPVLADVASESEGSWLITSEKHTQAVQVTTVWSRNGVKAFPTTWTTDDDDIVTLTPKFGSGGTHDGGWPYTGTK
jgi:hypothetical protein